MFKRIKNENRNISIKASVIIVFIGLVIIIVGSISYIIFSNWMSAEKDNMDRTILSINDEIVNKIETVIDLPLNINKTNYRLIEKNVIDIEDGSSRDRFFVSVLDGYKDEAIYSFSFGTRDGEYYGARLNENNEIEIMLNNEVTGGHSWYYSVTKEMLRGLLAVKAGEFDPRTRDWYKIAEESGGPSFSSIYKHFIMNDLTISASYPIYDGMGELRGVLGSHIILSKLNDYLKEIAENRQATALIVDKQSRELIANSLGKDNFITLEDGSFSRINVGDIDNELITKAFDYYTNSGARTFEIKGEDGKSQVNMFEYNRDGMDWLVMVSMPKSIFVSKIIENMGTTIIIVFLALILSLMIYFYMIRKLFKPMDTLIEATEKFAKGDLLQRAKIGRKDEIGRVLSSFNLMADTISLLINDLEDMAKERDLALEEASNKLEYSKDQLRLILDSTAEGIFGVDKEGRCTFCNAGGLRLLGYLDERELLGEDMHYKIHHSRRDGTSILKSESTIYKAFEKDEGVQVSDEVFWRSDGTFFDVEYFAYPQYRDGEIIGFVITFMDITERKKADENIKYLSYHDSLTGLYNRMFFEEEIKRLDQPRNLPISIISGDVNGLKLTNDIFGHSAGDKLLKTIADTFRTVCRADDIIARIGGDEFSILLPKTKEEEAEVIIKRIKDECHKKQIAAVKCSIALGSNTKLNADEDIIKTFRNAEDKMYKDKTLNRKNIALDQVRTIINTLHNKSDREKEHSERVNKLCMKIGKKIGLDDEQLKKLRDASYLHDIGKVVLDEEIINNRDSLTEEERKEIRQHPIIGFRILNSFDETVDLAKYALTHHERWDGSGYPKGLKGEEIPKISRIISVAENFDAMLDLMDVEEALMEIKRQSNKKFDPEIVAIFIELMNEK